MCYVMFILRKGHTCHVLACGQGYLKSRYVECKKIIHYTLTVPDKTREARQGVQRIFQYSTEFYKLAYAASMLNVKCIE